MTTTNAPDALSAVFANNEGADKMLVHSGSLSLSSADIGPTGGPKAFDIIVNLTTAFLYNPASGNLLLEVQNFSGGATTAFDGENAFGDPVSRVVTLDVNGVNDTTGNTDTFGLVTEFLAVAVVPEPPSIALFGFAVLVFAAMRRRRRTT
jgi:PEP-CTERM motif